MLRRQPWCSRWGTAIVIVCGLLCPAQALETDDGSYVTFDVHLTGGVVMEWADPAEAGHLFGLSVGVDWAYFRAAVGVAGVFPASNTEGAFTSIWLEGSGYPLAGVLVDYNVQPFVSVGVGLALEDGIDTPRVSNAIPPPAVRWSPRNPRLMFMAGVGVMYGDIDGFYATADVRLYNHTHGGLNVGVGYRF